MRSEELKRYAAARHNLKEVAADEPGRTYLANPETGEYFAVFERCFENGEETECCEILYEKYDYAFKTPPGCGEPFVEDGRRRVRVDLERADDALIYRLLDDAVRSSPLIVLPGSCAGFGDVTLPVRQVKLAADDSHTPRRIVYMRRLYQRGDNTFRQSCKNFYFQGKFMEDYEDEAEECGYFKKYYPTYNDLTTAQLRDYFTWRKAIRAGEPFVWRESQYVQSKRSAPTSFAFLYVYELLNGIGVKNPEETLIKLAEFAETCADAGVDEPRLYNYIKIWSVEFGAVNNVDFKRTARLVPGAAETYADDEKTAALKFPEKHDDAEIMRALRRFWKDDSRVLQKYPVEGERFFVGVWRRITGRRIGNKSVFTACIGKRKNHLLSLFHDAVYYDRDRKEEREYEFSPHRRYIKEQGIWRVNACVPDTHNNYGGLAGVMREIETRLRRLFKTGAYLKPISNTAWAREIVNEAIDEILRADAEAKRPKVNIDALNLQRIRGDFEFTRDALLTDEDTEDLNPEPEEEHIEEEPGGLNLDPLYLRLLKALLAGDPYAEMMRAHAVMPQVFADAVNEAFYDEIGDSVIEAEGYELSVAQDYEDEVRGLLEQ